MIIFFSNQNDYHKITLQLTIQKTIAIAVKYIFGNVECLGLCWFIDTVELQRDDMHIVNMLNEWVTLSKTVVHHITQI